MGLATLNSTAQVLSAPVHQPLGAFRSAGRASQNHDLSMSKTFTRRIV